MAIEQRPLSEVSNRESALSSKDFLTDKSTSSTINAVAGVIDTAVPIVDKFLLDRTLDRLDKEVSDALTDTSFDNIDLETQEVLTPEQTRSLLEADTGTSNFVREIDVLAASQRQGRGGKGQLDRADAVVKRFINEFPGREQEIREHAQNRLGLKQGVNAALAAAREDEAFQKSVERSIQTSFVQRAIDEGQGYVAVFQDGSVDIETTANRGRILAMLDEQLGFKRTRRGAGVGGGGKELTQSEIESEETKDLQGATAERLGQYTTSIMTQLTALVNVPEFTGNDAAQAQEIQRGLALQRSSEIDNVNLKYRGVYSDKAVDETVAQINSTFDRLDKLTRIPAQQLADNIAILDNSVKLKAHTLMPTIVLLDEVGLRDSINAMDATLQVIFGDKIQDTLANELKSVTAGVHQVRADAVINDVSNVAGGTRTFADMPVEQRNTAIQLSAAHMNEFVKNRNALTELQKNAFMNLYAQTSASGFQVETTQGLNNAVKIFAQKGYAETLKQIATDPNMKDRADIAGQVVNNLALKAYHRTAPELQRSLSGSEAFNLVYDPSTEQLEFDISPEFALSIAEEVPFGPPAPTLLPPLARAAARAQGRSEFRSPDPRLTRPSQSPVSTVIQAERIQRGTRTGIEIITGQSRNVESASIEELKALNNALNVLVDMKDFGIHKNSYAGMSDRQIKESLEASQGIPIKGGRASSLGGITDDKIEELKDVNRLQQEQTGTVRGIDRVFSFDPASDTFVQEE